MTPDIASHGAWVYASDCFRFTGQTVTVRLVARYSGVSAFNHAGCLHVGDSVTCSQAVGLQQVGPNPPYHAQGFLRACSMELGPQDGAPGDIAGLQQVAVLPAISSNAGWPFISILTWK